MCFGLIRNLWTCIFYLAALVFISYLLGTIPIEVVNILGLAMMKHFSMGLLMHGCFKIGNILGFLLAPFIQIIFSYNKLLIITNFIVALHPIVYPISKVWENFDYITLVFIIAGISGGGVSIFQYNQYLNMLTIQQTLKLSCWTGIQNSIFVLSSLFSGIILCFLSFSIDKIDLWELTLSAGIVYIFTLLLIFIQKKPNISIEFNTSKLFKTSKFLMNHFNIGLCKALIFSVFPYYLYSDIGFTPQIYTIGLYFLIITSGFIIGNIIGGVSLNLKLEKFVFIGTFLAGLFGIVPLIFETYFNSILEKEEIYWFIASMFALQLGAVDCFTLTIIANHSLSPKLQFIVYGCTTAAVWALVCFLSL